MRISEGYMLKFMHDNAITSKASRFYPTCPRYLGGRLVFYKSQTIIWGKLQEKAEH